MKISFKILERFIKWDTQDIAKITETLTANTSEIEAVHSQSQGLEKVFVGEILEITPHPNADKLQVTKTRVGSTEYTIVCGAKNIAVGQKVPVALVGASLPNGMKIEEADKRGVKSFGMLCSESELGLAEDAEGILILPANTLSGSSIIEVLGLSDTVLEIENTTITNRPDLFSHIGYARECVANGLAEWKAWREYTPSNPSLPAFPLNISITSPDTCTALAGIIIEGVHTKSSPAWMQQALTSCGIRPINTIVDITNFVMLELGMPLHAFDMASIAGKNLTMRVSQEGERVKTLDGQERILPTNVILMEDEAKIFDLCGIMGGENSQIQESTKTIWLHAPVYDPVRIRRASKALAHRTDASVIYEKRVPDTMAKEGLLRAIELILELCPESKITSQMLEITPPENLPILEVPQEDIERVLGQSIDPSWISEILIKLGCKIVYQDKKFTVTVPAFRLKDLRIKEDIIEELVRFYGLSKIIPELPSIDLTPVIALAGSAKERSLKNFFAYTAYETLHYAFLGKNLLEKAGMKTTGNIVEVANPISEDLSLMRPSLLLSLLDTLEKNYRLESTVALFEVGNVFSQINNTKQEEKNFAYVGHNIPFGEVKALFEKWVLQEKLPIKFSPSKNLAYFAHPGQSLDILFQGKCIGSIATLHPSIQKQFTSTGTTVCLEIHIDSILLSVQKPTQYKAFSVLPVSQRDQNIIVPKQSYIADMLRKLEKSHAYIQQISVIDEYTGKGIEEGMRSITLRVEYQSSEKTLTDEEIDTAHKAFLADAIKLGALIRS